MRMRRTKTREKSDATFLGHSWQNLYPE